MHEAWYEFHTNNDKSDYKLLLVSVSISEKKFIIFVFRTLPLKLPVFEMRFSKLKTLESRILDKASSLKYPNGFKHLSLTSNF